MLEMLEPVLRVLGANWMSIRLISGEVPISRERFMTPLYALRGVLKSRNFYFLGTRAQRWMKAEEMLKK